MKNFEKLKKDLMTFKSEEVYDYLGIYENFHVFYNKRIILGFTGPPYCYLVHVENINRTKYINYFDVLDYFEIDEKLEKKIYDKVKEYVIKKGHDGIVKMISGSIRDKMVYKDFQKKFNKDNDSLKVIIYEPTLDKVRMGNLEEQKLYKGNLEYELSLML